MARSPPAPGSDLAVPQLADFNGMPADLSLSGGPFWLLETPHHRAGEKKDDPCVMTATNMALIHNCWIRALNGLYVHAPSVRPTEFKNFVGYASRVYAAIKKHHDQEEELVFPLIEEWTEAGGLMSANVKQHEAFEHPFKVWGSHLFEMLESGTTSSFNASKFRDQIDAFAVPLQTHLVDEIVTLERLDQYPNCDILALGKRMEEEAVKHMEISELRDNLPVLLLNHDITFENGAHATWPPLPSLMGFAIRRLATFWHPGYWKYTTYSASQSPRDFEAAKS
ncbi:hypothetical protein M409DRAFT_18809 [Zasmidium cellare ATCC 36951]|uniref:Hemerythrin-like domain-containing protein n=1 Tax=Zasmidium cellare ATCC 36951 TaxID=1080233 RepID=A0A6A6CZN5_ZASCE|nr:uncharacterized protein M409DRAFT_18809 [Zasmidium cellare ATCC 36951]KAF2170836.1 hypothetical protein M409DRAFT_18809 [Zasmidium cellare ATCC 36951]